VSCCVLFISLSDQASNGPALDRNSKPFSFTIIIISSRFITCIVIFYYYYYCRWLIVWIHCLILLSLCSSFTALDKNSKPFSFTIIIISSRITCIVIFYYYYYYYCKWLIVWIHCLILFSLCSSFTFCHWRIVMCWFCSLCFVLSDFYIYFCCTSAFG